MASVRILCLLLLHGSAALKSRFVHGQTKVREMWHTLRGSLVQALDSGILQDRYPPAGADLTSLHRPTEGLKAINGADILRCLSALAVQEGVGEVRVCFLPHFILKADPALSQNDQTNRCEYEYGLVRWRIKQGQEAHENRFIETQAVLNEARSTESLYRTYLAQQTLTGGGNEEHLRLLQAAEAELEGSKLALKTLGEYIRKMEVEKVGADSGCHCNISLVMSCLRS